MSEGDKLGVLHFFGCLWLIETTWLDLPVSVQNCALTGLRSALLYGCLCFQVGIIEVFISALCWAQCFTPILIPYTNHFFVLFFKLTEDVYKKERVDRPLKKRQMSQLENV